MVEIPAALAARIERAEGPAGTAWLAELPGRFAAMIERWGLTVEGAPRHGAMSIVLPVSRGGGLFALKVAWLNETTIDEAAALRWWDGRGTVRLIDSLPEEGVLLLERLDPDRTLASAGLDEAATVTGELIRLLAIPTGPPMRTFAAEIGGILAGIEARWLAQGTPIDRAILDRVIRTAQSLPTRADHQMVNRDLWDDNVLAATRRPSLVIDPQPIAGPPEYAVVPSLLRRLDQMADPDDLDRFVARVCRAGALDLELAIAGAVVRIADYWL